RVRRKCTELLEHLDDRPVGDPLAVGEAAAADGAGADLGERLGDEARLADPGVADDRDQLAALLDLRALPGSPDQGELVLAADEARLVAPLRRIVHGGEPERCDRLRLP